MVMSTWQDATDKPKAEQRSQKHRAWDRPRPIESDRQRGDRIGEMTDRERGEAGHEGQLAVTQQGDVTDKSEHGTNQQPCADISRRIADRRRNSDQQRHRERLRNRPDGVMIDRHRPPIDESRHASHEEQNSRQVHCRIVRHRHVGVEWRRASAISASNKATHDQAVAPSQTQFVSSVLNSYADALFPEPHEGAPDVPWMRAIEADGELAGFMMVAERTEVQPIPHLWRFLIDARFQGRRVGVRALRLLGLRLQALGETELELSFGDARGGPEAFYTELGFVRTGEIDDDEVVARARIETILERSVTSRVRESLPTERQPQP